MGLKPPHKKAPANFAGAGVAELKSGRNEVRQYKTTQVTRSTG
jgi:hypothetical protein